MTKIKTKCQHCCRGRSQQTGEKQSITGPYLAEPWEGNNEEKWLMPLFKMRLILWEEPGWELQHEAGRGEAETTQGRFIHNNTVIQNMFHTFHRTAAGSRAEWCHSCTVSHLMLTCQSVSQSVSGSNFFTYPTLHLNIIVRWLYSLLSVQNCLHDAALNQTLHLWTTYQRWWSQYSSSGDEKQTLYSMYM